MPRGGLACVPRIGEDLPDGALPPAVAAVRSYPTRSHSSGIPKTASDRAHGLPGECLPVDQAYRLAGERVEHVGALIGGELIAVEGTATRNELAALGACALATQRALFDLFVLHLRGVATHEPDELSLGRAVHGLGDELDADSLVFGLAHDHPHVDRVTTQPVDSKRNKDVHLTLAHHISRGGEHGPLPELRAGVDFLIDVLLVHDVTALGAVSATGRFLCF